MPDDTIALEVEDETQEPDDSPAEEADESDDDSPNLVEKLKKTPEGQECLKKIGAMVCARYDADKDSCEEYARRFSDDWKLFAGDLPPKDVPFQDCLSRDTEILTRDGWKRIDQVSIGETVLTRRDEDAALEWNPVEATPSRFAEKLLHFKSSSINAMVTFGHEMIVQRRLWSKREKETFDGGTQRRRADDVWETTGLRAPLTGEWPGADHSGQIFGLHAGDVAEFVGWFLAEGSMQWSIQIAQSREANPGNCLRIEGLLARLGFEWAYARHAFTVHVTTMPAALVSMLKDQSACDEKRIPRTFFDQPPPVLRRMLDGLLLGDGWRSVSHGKYHSEGFYTTSPGLADDVQVLALLCGGRATIIPREPGNVSIIRGKPCVSRKRGYTVGILKRKWSKLDRAKHAIVDYNDTAYCVTVKNHSIYVRREGVAAWVGNCANGHVPLMLENLTRVHTRMNDEIFGDGSSIVQFTKLGPDDQIAEILSIHTNYQFSEEIPDFLRQQERGLLLFLMAGDATCHSYYNPRTCQNRHEILTVDEFVIPFVYTTTMPDYSDCPHRTRVLRYYRHELQAMDGDWDDVDAVISGTPQQWEEEPLPTFRFAVARSQHIEPGDETVDDNRPYVLLHHEGWEPGYLPDQNRDRFIQAIVDYRTQRVMKLTIHERVDWKEQARFDQQSAEKDAYKQALDMHTAMATTAGAQQGQLQASMDHIAKFGAMPNGMPPPPEPPPLPPPPPLPGWMQSADASPEKPRKIPINMFSHVVFIENLVGSLGMGAGRIQSDFNRAADVLLNQTIDQATLGNCQSFIHSDQVTFKDKFQMGPGKMHQVTGTNDIKNALVPIPVAQANPQLMQIVDKVWAWGQSSMQSPEVLSGESGKSGETWRGIAARIEQATKQLSVPARKYTKFVKQIAQNNCDLNALFLPDFELKTMFDYKVKLGVQVELSRKLYQRDLHVQIKADLRFATQAQRIAEADEIVQMTQAIPALAANPTFTYDALAQALRARNRDDLIPDLGQRPPPPPVFTLPPPPPPKGAAPTGNAPPVPQPQ